MKHIKSDDSNLIRAVNKNQVVENNFQFQRSFRFSYDDKEHKYSDEFLNKLINNLLFLKEKSFKSTRYFSEVLFMTNDIIVVIGVDSSTVGITVMANDYEVLESVYEKIKEEVKPFRKDFSQSYYFDVVCLFSSNGDIQSYSKKEKISEIFLDSAYPSISKKYKSVDIFAKEYFDSSESVLVLQGVPGTGKTRLLRKLILECCKSPNWKIQPDILYVNSSEVAVREQTFVKFLTGVYDILIIEDVDHLLESRQDGNRAMSSFLCASDGLISNTKKKVIFTTNLPNELNIDEALLRPGRCFDVINIGTLTKDEAIKIISDIAETNNEVKDNYIDILSHLNDTNTLAEIYKIINNISLLNHPTKFKTKRRIFGFN